MNKTIAIFGAAAALLLTALAVGLPTGAAPGDGPKKTPLRPPPVADSTHPGALTLSGKLSTPYVTPGSTDVFVSLAVEAARSQQERRAPVNFAVVIDRSGSMWGSKIEQARQATLALIDQLDDGDRITIVDYSNDASSTGGLFATGANKAYLRRYVGGLVASGGTNTSGGLRQGAASLRQAASDFRVNRLLLLSDGQPTIGATSTPALVAEVQSLRASGIALSALGVGADFNEDQMQRLAEVGGGSYGFISDANAAAIATLFQRDLQQAGTVVAQRVKLRFTLPPGVTFGEAYGRSVDVAGDTIVMALPDFSSGQTERMVLRLRAQATADADVLDVARFSLDYFDVRSEAAADSRLALSAQVTTDTTVAEANVDQDAFVAATRARAAVNYEAAAQAISSGRFEEANRVLADNEALFAGAEAVAGSGAIAADRKVQKQMLGASGAAAAQPAPVRAEAVKRMKVESKRSAGYGDSVY